MEHICALVQAFISECHMSSGRRGNGVAGNPDSQSLEHVHASVQVRRRADAIYKNLRQYGMNHPLVKGYATLEPEYRVRTRLFSTLNDNTKLHPIDTVSFSKRQHIGSVSSLTCS